MMSGTSMHERFANFVIWRREIGSLTCVTCIVKATTMLTKCIHLEASTHYVFLLVRHQFLLSIYTYYIISRMITAAAALSSLHLPNSAASFLGSFA
ncbi:hypothetical protein LINPERHAP1_LOCUS31504 [Linum perenne]